MFYIFPIPSLRSPLILLILPCVLTAGVYRERLRKKYIADVTSFGSLRFITISSSEFDYGLCDCCRGEGAVKNSIFYCLCCPVRLSVNASATGFGEFWWILIMTTFFFPFVPIIGYILRLHMRDMFGMNPHPVADFFAWLFCYCCALSQESRLIDHGFEAIRTGTPIVLVDGNPRPPYVDG